MEKSRALELLQTSMEKHGLNRNWERKSKTKTDSDVKQEIEFKFEAWIHPKHGGDDYPVRGSAYAINEDAAKIAITKHLKRKSAIVDFKIIK